MRLSFPTFSNLAALAPAPGPSYLLYDTFTDTDGTALTSHTMDVGSGWTATDSRQWTIKSNRVAADAGSTTPPQNATHANAGQGDVSISLSTQLGGASSGYYIGACARVTDGNNLWVIAYVTETATWSLIKRSSGTDTVVTYGPNFPIGTGIVYHTLTVLMRDDVFVVSVNGTVQCTWIDSTYKTNTKFGMVGDRLGIDTDGWRRDDFKVIAAPAQTTYVSDDFSEANGTNLSGKSTDTGQTWTVHSGTWDVTGGKARKTATASIHQQATVDAGVADCVVATTYTPAAGTNAAIICRFVDGSNHWMIYDEGGTAFRLYEKVAGSFSSRASAAVTFVNGTPYVFRGVLAGESIACSVDGGNVIAYHAASSFKTATRHGLGSYDAAGTFDDFSVKSL